MEKGNNTLLQKTTGSQSDGVGFSQEAGTGGGQKNAERQL